LFGGGLPSKIRGHLGSRYRLGLVGFLCFCYRTALSNTVVGRSYLWLNWTGGKWSLKKVGHPQEDHMSGQFLAISQPRSPQNAVVYLRESYQKGPLVQVQFAQIFDLGHMFHFFQMKICSITTLLWHCLRHLKMKTEGTQPSLELADFMEMNAFQSLKVPWFKSCATQNQIWELAKTAARHTDFLWANWFEWERHALTG